MRFQLIQDIYISKTKDYEEKKILFSYTYQQFFQCIKLVLNKP